MSEKSIFLSDHAWEEKWNQIVRDKRKKIRCKKCLFDEDTPNINFDSEGICNYCRKQEELESLYPGGKEGSLKLEQISQEIKKKGRKNKYDVIVGVSGGCDSTYLIYLSKKLGLRPLAVHFDNTWNSTIAVENIQKALNTLGVDLWTYVVDNEEYNELYLSMLRSGTPDLDAPTDIALASVLNNAAVKFNVKYIFEGHSFRTEGLAPLGWIYIDAKYIYNIQKQFGKNKLKTFPYMWMSSQLKWMLVNRLKKIRPLWYIDYNKENTKDLLKKKFGWQWYGGHHLENRITAFYHSYFLPRRFGVDFRTVGFSALIRSGQMTREEGIQMIDIPPKIDLEIVEIFRERLGLTKKEFVELMEAPIKSYRDYKTYKPLFEKFRPFFRIMAAMDLIPMSFYIKYTSKNDI